MKKGFTLIELLVVVLIIGILTSVAMPQYRKSVMRAEMVEGLTNGKTIYDSAIRYKSVNGEVPTSFTNLDVGFIGTEDSNSSSFDDGNFIYSLHGTYVSAENQKVLEGQKYTLIFEYPIVSEEGVEAGIYCTPKDHWVCANAAAGKSQLKEKGDWIEID